MYFSMYKDASKQWRWTLYADNNKVIGDSGESYHNKGDCRHAIDLIKRDAAGANVWNADSKVWE